MPYLTSDIQGQKNDKLIARQKKNDDGYYYTKHITKTVDNRANR